ncbi:MAG: hypothetical protein ABI717_00855 [Actinomycetota bacterium]
MDTNDGFRKLVVRVVLFVLIGWAVALMRAVRRERGWDDWTDTNREWKPAPLPVENQSDEQPAKRRPFRAHKLATSMGLVVVFFAAASFTAGAGDMVAKAFDPARCAALMQVTGEDDSVCADMMQDEAAPEASPLPDPAAAAPEAAEPAEPASEVPAELAADLAAAEAGADLGSASAADASLASEQAASSPDASAAAPAAGPESYVLAPEQPEAAASSKSDTRHWVVKRAKESKLAAAAVEDEGGAPTVWLNRALPDPTPPAKRLSPEFAKNLQRISGNNGVSWSLVLGVLRAEGARDRVPATVRELNALARGLSQRGAADSEWNAALSLSGRTGFADRAVALARYNRVVGLRALVDGLEAEKQTLGERLLLDPRITMYGGGREDVTESRIDVRVIVLVSYLAESYGEVTVSSLFSGHRKYARPGVVSAHIYGQAVDIATVGKLPIAGHQQPGSVTEKAVRSILMLPVELQPRQVISLLGLGGPSFPMADHDDHIHVGF